MNNSNRRQAIAKAIIARSPSSAANGGTTAPKDAANRIGPGRPVAGPGAQQPKGVYAPQKPKTPKPPPPSTAGPAAPAETAMPWNSKYEQTVGEANRKYLNTISNLDLSEQATKQEYGLDSGFNDYKSNPYSRASALEKSYETANRGTTNSAGLQLYAGSTSNRLGQNRATRDLNWNNLNSEYQTALGGITAERVKAKEAQREADQEAYWNRVREAEETEPSAEAAPADSGGDGPGASSSPGGKKKKKQTTRTAATKNAIANNKKAR